MRPIEDQIRDYATYADEVIGWIDTPPMIAPTAEAATPSDDSEPDEGDLIMVDIQTPAQDTASMERRRWPGVAFLAAAAAIVVIAGVNLFGDSDDTATTDIADSEEADTSEVDSSEAFGAGSALEVAEAYFAAFNDGDAAAAMALFADDVRFSSNFTGPTETDLSLQQLEWNVAQGTVMTEGTCSVAAEVPGESVRVLCLHGTHDAPSQAVGALPVRTATNLVVTEPGISEFEEIFGGGGGGSFIYDFNSVADPFERWMVSNHPDDVSSIGFRNWTSVESAIANGELTAQFAAEWAAYLDESGCTYLDEDC